MDRGLSGADISDVPSVSGLAALQDLDILLEGFPDLRVKRSLCRQVMDARRRLLGPEHPATLETEARIAAIGLELDDYSTARTSTPSCWSAASASSGRVTWTLSPPPTVWPSPCPIWTDPRRPAPFTSGWSRGAATRSGRGPGHAQRPAQPGPDAAAVADDASARGTFEALLEVQRKTLGRDSLAVIRTLANLGSVLISIEDYAGASKVLAERVERSRRVLGPTHPDTLEAMLSLARAQVGAGDRAEGRALSEQTLAATISTLGPDNPATLAARGQHGRLLLRVATRLLPHRFTKTCTGVSSARSARGNRHPRRPGRSCRRAGQCGEHVRARKLDQQLLEERRRILGEDHVATQWR